MEDGVRDEGVRTIGSVAERLSAGAKPARGIVTVEGLTRPLSCEPTLPVREPLKRRCHLVPREHTRGTFFGTPAFGARPSDRRRDATRLGADPRIGIDEDHEACAFLACRAEITAAANAAAHVPEEILAIDDDLTRSTFGPGHAHS